LGYAFTLLLAVRMSRAAFQAIEGNIYYTPHRGPGGPSSANISEDV
jgi:hypothetical protein